MAGDWIKLEHATLDKPEILELAELLSVSHGEALLYCLRFWVWADQQIVTDMSRKSHALRVTKTGLDALMRCPGFTNALAHIGWLSGPDGSLVLTNFDRHNGKTAKERALATKRKQVERINNVTELSRSQRDKTATREEKRRSKDISKTPLPDDFVITDRIREWAAEKGIHNLEAHFAYFVNQAHARAYRYANWERAFMNAVTGDWAKIGRGADPSQPRRVSL